MQNSRSDSEDEILVVDRPDVVQMQKEVAEALSNSVKKKMQKRSRFSGSSSAVKPSEKHDVDLVSSVWGMPKSSMRALNRHFGAAPATDFKQMPSKSVLNVQDGVADGSHAPKDDELSDISDANSSPSDVDPARILFDEPVLQRIGRPDVRHLESGNKKEPPSYFTAAHVRKPAAKRRKVPAHSTSSASLISRVKSVRTMDDTIHDGSDEEDPDQMPAENVPFVAVADGGGNGDLHASDGADDWKASMRRGVLDGLANGTLARMDDASIRSRQQGATGLRDSLLGLMNKSMLSLRETQKINRVAMQRFRMDPSVYAAPRCIKVSVQEVDLRYGVYLLKGTVRPEHIDGMDAPAHHAGPDGAPVDTLVKDVLVVLPVHHADRDGEPELEITSIMGGADVCVYAPFRELVAEGRQILFAFGAVTTEFA
jgi:hypothetical protein